MNIVTPESIAVFCLTPGGIRLARQLQAHLPLTCYCSDKLLEAGFEPFVGNFAKTVAQAFHTHTALIVIGATGLTVRVIAPLLKDKLTDPAVVVIDERGRHVISLLSGHVGGANALTRYLAGELDWMDRTPAGQFPRLQQEYPDQAVSVPDACSYAYLFNLSDKGPEALKDLRVRQALSYAVDRDIIVDKVLQGGQKPAYWWTHWATEGFEAPDIEMAKWTQAERVEKAKALLAEAGYGPDKPLKLSIQYNTSDDHKKLAVAVQQFWKQIGVQVELANYEWKVHTDRLQNQDFEVARYAWCADYNEPSTFVDYFRTGGYNNGKFSNPDYDKALEEAKTAADPAPLYKKAEEILIDNMALVPVYHYAKPMMVKSDLRGWPKANVMNDWYAKDMYRVAE